ncbi:MAG: hypothetical protein ACRC6T_16840 [Sarcina sp.]
MFELFRKKPKSNLLLTEVMDLSEYAQKIYNNMEIILDSIANKRFQFTLDVARSNYNFSHNLQERLSNLEYRLKEKSSSNTEIFIQLEETKYKSFVVTDFLHDLITFSPNDIELDKFFYYVLDSCKDLMSNIIVFLNNLFNYIDRLSK